MSQVNATEDAEPAFAFGFAYTLLCILGVVVLLGGVYGVVDAAMMDPTVPPVSSYSTERRYDQGLMHRREIKLLGSGIAVISGILAVGVGITGHIGIRILRELQESRVEGA